ncbi:hypothetical protein ACEPAF_6094 [Sanghuangporus sanghuang]
MTSLVMDVFSSLPRLAPTESMLVPAAFGLVTYLIYKRFEILPSSELATVFLLFVVPLASSVFLLHHYSDGLAVLSGFSIYYASLLSSIAVYRASPWHPLARYPGPFLAKVSQFWLARETTKGKWHETLKELHDKYGAYVRVGPNQLSFVDASLIPKIMGSDGMPKGPMFDGARIPHVPANVVAIRDLSEHAQLRKPWAKGLSTAAIKEYSPTVVKRALQLAEELDKFAEKGESTDLAMWMSRFAFDFMGDMVFGGAFELMKEGDTSGIWGMITEQMKAQALLQRLPWSVHIVHKLPFVVAAMAKFTKFVNDCVARRSNRGARVKDLFYYLANEDSDTALSRSEKSSMPYGNVSHELALLRENCKVAIVAGSDTTATTISNMFYYLMTNKEVLARLRNELDEAFPPGDGEPFDFVKLSELKILNAVINETLRLQPPVPTDLQRAPAAGSGSKRIGEHIIPEGTSVNISPYVLHRQARYFSPMPEKFWIDRWLQSPMSKVEPDSTSAHYIHDTSAYIPFAYGPANCAGKALALAEIRSVTALLLQRFDIDFVEELRNEYVEKNKWEKEINSFFVFRLGELRVVIKRRA